jgi:hypothetical protein
MGVANWAESDRRILMANLNDRSAKRIMDEMEDEYCFSPGMDPSIMEHRSQKAKDAWVVYWGLVERFGRKEVMEPTDLDQQVCR